MNPNTEDFSSVSNENAIKQSVRNLVMTQFGERPFQFDIGSRVRGLMFLQQKICVMRLKILLSDLNRV
jgi:phage baseplate assembly protein W